MSCAHCGAAWIRCGTCNAPMYMHGDRLNELKENGETFYCPNGHARHYPKGPSSAERERDAARASLRSAEARAERAEREATAARRAMNRCDACKRGFDSPEKLAAHRKRVHTRPLALPADAGKSS